MIYAIIYSHNIKAEYALKWVAEKCLERCQIFELMTKYSSLRKINLNKF